MIRIALIGLVLSSSAAQANVLMCEFTPEVCVTGLICDPFRVTIDTHHSPDAPLFQYGGEMASIQIVPDQDAGAPSFITLGYADREIITLFDDGEALHTRHTRIEDVATALTSLGSCFNFDL